MAQIFISYSRVDKVFTRTFVTALREMFTTHVVWFDEELTGGDDWWKEILRQIDQSAIFIYLLSNESVNSAYCQAEFAEAQRLRKRIITVQVRDRTDVPDNLNSIQYVDMKDGMEDAEAQRKLVRAINKYLQNLPTRRPRPLSSTPTPKPEVKKESERQPHQPEMQTPDLNIIADSLSTTQTRPVETPAPVVSPRPPWMSSSVLMGILLVLIVGIGVLFAINGRGNQTPTNTPQATTAVAQVESPTETPTVTLTASATLEPEAAARATIDTANIQTAEANMLFQAAEAQTLAPTWTAAVEQTATMALVQSATAYQDSVNAALTAISLTATATLWTNTPTPTPNATQTLEAFARTPMPENTVWMPVEQVIDGVTMVYVPAGCFMMGSTGGEQCFTQPFWLDKTEVTQAQFVAKGGVKANANGFTGDDRPVESITWREAEAYCREKRGGRLPTEAEWEFAARGPDGLIYPWGDEFVAPNVVYSGNSGNQTGNVGDDIRGAGASWVGALDMSGNVWEWTSSLYRDYPYDPDDGREDLAASGSRVVRGGSWDVADGGLRAAYRGYGTTGDTDVGFRCARSSLTE